MRFIFQLILISISLVTLSGCTNWMQLTNAPAKQDAPNQIPQPIQRTCKNWCHNGWCSTHCEAI